MELFESPRAGRGRAGKTLAGVWVNREEAAVIRALADERGFTSVADYFRHLLREDMDAHGAPPRTTRKGDGLS